MDLIVLCVICLWPSRFWENKIFLNIKLVYYQAHDQGIEAVTTPLVTHTDTRTHKHTYAHACSSDYQSSPPPHLHRLNVLFFLKMSASLFMAGQLLHIVLAVPLHCKCLLGQAWNQYRIRYYACIHPIMSLHRPMQQSPATSWTPLQLTPMQMPPSGPRTTGGIIMVPKPSASTCSLSRLPRQTAGTSGREFSCPSSRSTRRRRSSSSSSSSSSSTADHWDFLVCIICRVCHAACSPVVLYSIAYDDTTVIGLILDGDEGVYRKEAERLAGWCADNNLVLNVSKSKEMIIDFRKAKSPTPCLMIKGADVDLVDSFKFLGFFVSNDLSCAVNCSSTVKRCHMRLHFLRQLKKFGLNQMLLTQFYRSVTENVVSLGISVWFAGTSSSDINQLERIVRQASCIVGGVLPSIASLYSTRLRSRARKIIGDPCNAPSQLSVRPPPFRQTF